MRTLSKILAKIKLLIIALSLVAFLDSCDKCECATPENETVGFSDEIRNIVPQSIIDDLRKNGMEIHEGKVPPNISGAYLFSPLILTKPVDIYDAEVGTEFISEKYKFYNLSNQNQVLSIDTKAVIGESYATGQGAYVSGSGNYFTIFSELSGVNVENGNTITSKQIQAISGELTANGIKNVQLSLTMKSKTGDPGDKYLIKVGQSRIFKDGDGLSEKISNFRERAQSAEASGNVPCLTCVK